MEDSAVDRVARPEAGVERRHRRVVAHLLRDDAKPEVAASENVTSPGAMETGARCCACHTEGRGARPRSTAC